VAEQDVVVVGAGTSGCALAARLVDAGLRVLLLEAGEDHPGGFPAELLDPARMAAAVPGHPAAWHLEVELTGERRVPVQRGRVVGGSSALNAAVFLRATPADFDGWAALGNDLWSYERVLPTLRRLETDRDFGASPVHGADGPVPVQRFPADHPVADAFAVAVEELGIPAEPDKNAGGAPGFGPVPFTIADGVRVNTAMAYLAPRRHLPGLTVRGGVLVRRVLVERGRAVGVETSAGVVRAATVVLSAGVVGSAQLLLRSGVGPAAALSAAGIAVVVDARGVGTGASDHPQVYLGWRPARPLPDGRLPLSGALHTDQLELLPWLTPFSRVTSADAGDDLAIGVGLQRAESRGELTLRDGDPDGPPRLRYGYLRDEPDRRGLRNGVRLAAELLRSRAFAALGAERVDLPDEVLADDTALDGWIRSRVATAVHLCGTARMGPDDDRGAVVDQELRVRGVEGLRVVDTSVLPTAPSRGPAATAVLLGERAADLMTGRLSRPPGPSARPGSPARPAGSPSPRPTSPDGAADAAG
jgi:predicted dehydrogenase (TIGR03970 family)